MKNDAELLKHQKKENFISSQNELERLRHERVLELQKEKEMKVLEIKMQKEMAA